MAFIKDKFRCITCKNGFIVAYDVDIEDEVTHCPFCGEDIIVPDDEE